MASKVMVKMPVSPFSQVSKTKTNLNGEVVTISRSSDAARLDAHKPTDTSRVAQLEQNIRYLQEQHQLMLTGLHHEIDSLRHRNRELQFQLIFVKGSNISTPSSPEEDAKHKVYISPKQINITPLQVELLEKELGEMKIQLQESESRNVYLSAIVDEQKKKLERYERERERERERGIQPDPDLLRKLDDAESLIRRLQRENSDLRRENVGSVISSREYHNREGYVPQRGGPNHSNQSRGRGRGNGGNHYRSSWFPPLHSQSFWQNGRGQGQDRNESASLADGGSLPNLQQNVGGGGAGNHHFPSRRGGGGNNNQYNGEGKRYRHNQNRSQKPPS